MVAVAFKPRFAPANAPRRVATHEPHDQPILKRRYATCLVSIPYRELKSTATIVSRYTRFPVHMPPPLASSVGNDVGFRP